MGNSKNEKNYRSSQNVSNRNDLETMDQEQRRKTSDRDSRTHHAGHESEFDQDHGYQRRSSEDDYVSGRQSNEHDRNEHAGYGSNYDALETIL